MSNSVEINAGTIEVGSTKLISDLPETEVTDFGLGDETVDDCTGGGTAVGCHQGDSESDVRIFCTAPTTNTTISIPLDKGGTASFTVTCTGPPTKVISGASMGFEPTGTISGIFSGTDFTEVEDCSGGAVATCRVGVSGTDVVVRCLRAGNQNLTIHMSDVSFSGDETLVPITWLVVCTP